MHSQQLQFLPFDCVECTRDQAHQQKTEAQCQDVQIGQYGGHQKVPAADGYPVKKNEGDGVLQHGKGYGAEEQQYRYQQPAHQIPVGQEQAHLGNDHFSLRRHHQLDVLAQGLQQQLFFHEMGQCQQDQGEQRDD